MNKLGKDLQMKLDVLWTTQDLCSLFNKTGMTIGNWRKHRGLPCVVINGKQRPTIRFVPTDVLAWAKKQNIKVEHHGLVQRSDKGTTQASV